MVEYAMGEVEGLVSLERWSCSRGAWWSMLWERLTEWSL